MSGYFSDRERGPRPRTSDTFTAAAWGGVVAAVRRGVVSGAFGGSFPEGCPDQRGVSGTDASSMGMAVLAEIPDLAEATPSARVPSLARDSFTGWPLDPERLPPTLAILDLLEFCFRHVSEPIEGEYHSFFSHYHLGFRQEDGQARWRDDMNALLARNGLAYEITSDGAVIRLGTTVETERVRQTVFATGDTQLDELLDRAREKYLSVDPAHRSECIEQLWDAFERSKTLKHGDKKQGVQMLILQAASTQEMAQRLDAEARELTAIGNDFRIRHHETSKVPLSGVEVEYLFHRCFSLLALLLHF